MTQTIDKYSHIPTSEMELDIAETEAEIVSMQEEIKMFEATPPGHIDFRWNHMRADAKRHGIKERQEFIQKVKAIIESRK